LLLQGGLPWWGRGWEDGMVRLGRDRLGQQPDMVSASEQPQLQGTHYGPTPQKGRFRKAPRKAEPQRSDIGTSVEAYKRSAFIPPVEETAFYPSLYPIGTLIKPLFFTVGFTGMITGWKCFDHAVHPGELSLEYGMLLMVINCCGRTGSL
uniref:Uncharacterized protein n=1 Tax=Theropithecus gelada TaxID=9565 RepID=A0A8D2EKY8_THEGE